MKNSYYETLDKNFNEALNLLEGNFSHNELVSMLENGNIPQKQFAALQMAELYTKEEALILLHNLVGQDGKIREVVSLKIREFTANPDYFEIFNLIDMEELANSFFDAIIDINGNICRNILDVLPLFKNNSEFTKFFTNKLVNEIFKLLDVIKDFDIQDGKYKINKEIFKLYWELEAVNIFYDKIDKETLKRIVKTTSTIDEYTIREKTAKILSNPLTDKEFLQVKSELKNDKNYYVRRF